MLALLPIVGVRAVMQPLRTRISFVRTVYAARVTSHAALLSGVSAHALLFPT